MTRSAAPTPRPRPRAWRGRVRRARSGACCAQSRGTARGGGEGGSAVGRRTEAAGLPNGTSTSNSMCRAGHP
eukprot:365415-Chlamydomonas_euryale.AAC.5